MKRFLTLLIVASIASFSFAQAKRNLKATPMVKVPRVLTSTDLTRAMNFKQREQASTARNQSSTPNNRRAFATNSRSAKVVGSTVTMKRLLAPISKASASDIIINPAEGDTTYYRRSGFTFYVDEYGYTSFDSQDGHVAIVDCGNGDVYIKDPVSKFTYGTWVKGKKAGNTITVATRQPLAANAPGTATLSLRWCSFDSDGLMIPADETADHFTFTIAGDCITLEGTNDYLLMGLVWDDDNTAFGYGDYNTVWTADPGYKPASTQPVVAPEDLETATWYARGTIMTSISTDRYKHDVTLGFDGNDVYIKGFFDNFPDSWIKGSIKDGVATFPALQFLGKHNSMDTWAIGAEWEGNTPVIKDFRMTYDADTRTFTALNDLLENNAEDRVFFVNWLTELTLTAEAPSFPPVPIPYSNSLQTAELLDEMTIINANGDDYTWEFSDGEGAGYRNHGNLKADDWLITRGIELKAGKAYAFSFDMHAAGYTERIAVKMGTAPTAEAMTITVMRDSVFTNGVYETVEHERIMVPADGVYYFGIHAISDADQYAIYVRNIYVGEGLLPESPSVPENVILMPAPDASNLATLTCDAPTTRINGETIAAGTPLTMHFYRNGMLVSEVPCTPGQKGITCTDAVPSPALYAYKVIAYDGDLRGDKAVIRGWVGLDRPGELTNVEIYDTPTSLVTSWDPVTSVGMHGGVVLPATTVYNMYDVEMYDYFGEEIPLLADQLNPEPLTDTHYTHEINTCEGDQRIAYYGVLAENTTGTNKGTLLSMVLGKPYELMLHESFDGSFSYLWEYSSSSALSGASVARDPSDGDYGNIELFSTSTAHEVVRFESGKIALGGAANAFLCIDAKKAGIGKSTVRIIAHRAGQAAPVVVATLSLTTKYALYKVSLDAFKDDPWIRFYVQADFEGKGTVSIDNITVADLKADDVSIALSAPKYTTAGKGGTVKVVVTNDAENIAKDYAIRFFANGDLFAEIAADKTTPLATGKSAEFSATYKPSVFTEAGLVTLTAEAVYAPDLDLDDNTAAASTTVVLPAATPVASLSATTSSEGLTLSWTTSDVSVKETLEDFESFPGNTIYRDGEYCGDWLAVDMSQGYCYGWMNSDILWPYGWEVFAFGIIDTKASRLDSEASLSALSGVNALGFFSEANVETLADQTSDRYLISPELPGVAQTIYFNTCSFTLAYGADTYEVLASSTDRNLSSFTKVAEFSQTELGWQSLTADLPAGTKYFAIHYTSPCTFGMLLDDITYQTGGAVLTGFNIYVDREKSRTVGADASSYTFAAAAASALRKVAAAEGTHTVSVTALYGDAESLPVSVEVGEITGITSPHAAVTDDESFSLSGIRLADKHAKGVRIVNGQKRVLSNHLR